jgi:metal-responsive CopG/Arc/MetJ family transcriptional regulator
MAAFTINIPEQFLPVLDEMVAQSGAGARATWVKNVIANVMIDYQLRKEFGQDMQARNQQLWSFWA